MSEFDFSAIPVPQSGNYLQPGYYTVNISDIKYVKPTETKADGSAKTSYLEITFQADQGSITEKFYITPKALSRLQYLYANMVGSPLDKAFKNEEQIGAYFEKAFSSDKAKTIKKNIVVGGKEVGERVFAAIPYSDYFLPEDMNPEFGAFDANSSLYKRYLQRDNNPSKRTDSVMIADSNPFGESSDNDSSDDLPF